jgi:hypothetical protein
MVNPDRAIDISWKSQQRSALSIDDQIRIFLLSSSQRR